MSVLKGLLTGLVGGNVDGDVLGRVRALAGHAVDSLDLKHVGRVRPQAADEHARVTEAQLPRHELHIVVARRARPPVGAALAAQHVVDHVLTGPRLSRRVPLQDHRGLIHDRDDVPRARGNTCDWKTQ